MPANKFRTNLIKAAQLGQTNFWYIDIVLILWGPSVSLRNGKWQAYVDAKVGKKVSKFCSKVKILTNIEILVSSQQACQE